MLKRSAVYKYLYSTFLFELFPFVKFSCLGHNSRSAEGNFQIAYKGRGHSVEMQCLRTITLSYLILLLSPFYIFSIFVIYINQELELFKVFSSNYTHNPPSPTPPHPTPSPTAPHTKGIYTSVITLCPSPLSTKGQGH